jgi:hypothetical protein
MFCHLLIWRKCFSAIRNRWVAFSESGIKFNFVVVEEKSCWLHSHKGHTRDVHINIYVTLHYATVTKWTFKNNSFTPIQLSDLASSWTFLVAHRYPLLGQRGTVVLELVFLGYSAICQFEEIRPHFFLICWLALSTHPQKKATDLQIVFPVNSRLTLPSRDLSTWKVMHLLFQYD